MAAYNGFQSRIVSIRMRASRSEDAGLSARYECLMPCSRHAPTKAALSALKARGYRRLYASRSRRPIKAEGEKLANIDRASKMSGHEILLLKK